MSSDYDAIRADNITRRGTEFADLGGLIAEKLYTDRMHFVYELLQNAEDAGASRVVFDLRSDRLELRHYGGRLFDTKDVQGVSDVLHGTKAHDPSKIGRFGIGFKSVFAFTATPEIHSGDEHFQIREYIRPHAADPLPLAPDETLMIFPFNHDTLTAEQAHAQISRRLVTLGAKTLLFLKAVSHVDYAIAGGVSGAYTRDTDTTDSPHRVTVRDLKNSDATAEAEEVWLLFERPVHGEDGELVRPVEIAYRVRYFDREPAERVVPTPDASIAVSFPTDQKTDLGFLVNGPYDTTVARDNIRSDESWNKKLVLETAELVVESLHWLRMAGLLSMGVLESMPLKSPESVIVINGRQTAVPGSAYKDGFLRPIYERVRQALLTEDLLPLQSGGHAAASGGKLGRGTEIRALLANEQLRRLFKSHRPLAWLSDEATEARTPALHSYLRTALGIDEVTPELFATRFDADFISVQDDAWVMSLYAFLDMQKALWRAPYWNGTGAGLMRGKPFVRLGDGSHVAPFDELGRPRVYLPSTLSSHFPTVRETVAADPRAFAFLRSLGLSVPELADYVVDFVLPKYKATDSPPNWTWPKPVDKNENLGDIKVVAQALRLTAADKKVHLVERVKAGVFLLTNAALGENTRYRNPAGTYLRSAPLLDYFDGNPETCFLDQPVTPEEEEALVAVGVAWRVRVFARAPSLSQCVIVANSHSNHVRGLNGFDPACRIDGLKHALGTITPSKAAFIWNKLLIPNRSRLYGTVESSTNQNFGRSTTLDKFSAAGTLVAGVAWIMGPDGVLHRPGELHPEDLPVDFARDEVLMRTLGIEPAIATATAQAFGLEVDEVRFIMDHRESLNAWMTEQRRLEAVVVIPPELEIDYKTQFKDAFARPAVAEPVHEPPNEEPIRNPERYRQRQEQELLRQQKEEALIEMRFRRVPRKVWEDKNGDVRAFLQAEYAGLCQICHTTFPKRDGKAYFEGVYIVSRTGARWLDQPGNVLCLCATCTAKLEHGAVEAGDMVDQVRALETRVEGSTGHPVVRLCLCGVDAEIRFTEQHLVRLQALLGRENGPSR